MSDSYFLLLLHSPYYYYSRVIIFPQGGSSYLHHFCITPRCLDPSLRTWLAAHALLIISSSGKIQAHTSPFLCSQSLNTATVLKCQKSKHCIHSGEKRPAKKVVITQQSKICNTNMHKYSI